MADRLAALDLLVVSDIFLSETAAMADVVLPTAQWAEEDGHDDQPGGPGAAPPPRAAAARRGAGRPADCSLRWPPDSAGANTSRTTRRPYSTSCAGPAPAAIADYAGISYERIDAEQGVFWPCPTLEHPGTPRLFVERFPTPDGRARFFPVDHTAAGRGAGPPLSLRADDRAG